MSFRTLAVTLALLALAALALRVTRLDERPPHTDEAINAWLLGRVLAGEPFAFDPRDRHGPLLPAAGWIVARLSGRNAFADLDERTIRLAPALIGAAATGLLALGHGLLPASALVSTAVLWTIAPLPLYFARYAIHETLLVSATLATLLLLARAFSTSGKNARLGWCAAAGATAGLMLASKLSAGIPFAALAVAAVFAAWTNRRLHPGSYSPFPFIRKWLPPVGVAAASGALVVVAAYSWGFRRFQGIHDLVFGTGASFARAAGQGHEKGTFYLLSILGFGGAGIVLLSGAAAGAVLAWKRGGPLGRGLCAYAVVLIALHSAIPYKTPWLALGLWLPLATLCGWSASALLACAWRRAHLVRVTAAATLAGALGLTASSSYALVFADPASESNPLAYAHTSPDLIRLEPLVAALPAAEPLIAVCLEDPWPLPFLLRHHSRVGYWQPGQELPAHPDLLITTPEQIPTLDPRFASWRPHYFSQRPGVILVALEPAAAAVSPAP